MERDNFMGVPWSRILEVALSEIIQLACENVRLKYHLEQRDILFGEAMDIIDSLLATDRSVNVVTVDAPSDFVETNQDTIPL